MSNLYYFGTGNGRVFDGFGARIDAIAQKHKATFVWATVPGDGPRYWFCTRDWGFPSNRDTASAVLGELESLGLWKDGKLVFKKDGVS
jgi:hypothetical protein